MPASQRVFDMVLAAGALAVATVPLAVACLLLRATGTRSVVYPQERVGRHGQSFRLFKLRTMRTLSGTGPSVTVAGDGRVTRVGAVLRRWKIDELPQLVNVLRGELRIIGPRPEVPRFARHYTLAEREILDYQPGLASMSQVVYPHEADLLRTTDDPEQAYVRDLLPRKVAVDLAYEQRRTWRSDAALVIELLWLVAGRPRLMDTSVRVGEGEASLTASIASRQP